MAMLWKYVILGRRVSGAGKRTTAPEFQLAVFLGIKSMKHLLLVVAILQILWAQQKHFTPEQLVIAGELRGKTLSNIQWMPDGNSFLYLEPDPQTETYDILQHDVVSGEVRTLVCGKNLEIDGDRVKIRHYLISPDGGFFIFTGSLVARRMKTGGNFYRFDLKTGKLTALTATEEEQKIIRVSPQGDRVGFVRANNLFVLDLGTLEERQLTADGSADIINGNFDWVYEEEFGIIQGWEWSPDGEHIAYWQLDQSRVPLFPLVNYEDAHPEVEWMRYPKPGDPNSTARIGVISVATRQTRWMDTDENFYLPRIQWLPDSKTLAIQRLNREQNRLELLFADTASGESRVVLSETQSPWINICFHLAFWAKGEGTRFLWSSERSGYLHLYLYGDDGKEVRQLTRGDWEIADVAAVSDQWVYFTAHQPSLFELHLFRVGLEGGPVEQLTKERGMHAPIFSPDCRYYLDIYSNLETLPQTVLCRSDGTRARAVVENKMDRLAGYALGRTEFFSFDTRDGVQLNGFFIKPGDFDPQRKYPVLMYVYGGPGSQTVCDVWDNRKSSKWMWHHYLTQKGYVIATVDNRGTGGRGKAFRDMVYRNLGKWESHDQIEAAKYLAGLPWVDQGRIGIWGWSYGGYAAALTLCKGGSLFKAGICVAPVTHWQYYNSIYTERFMSTPEKNPEGYRESSPIAHAKGLTGKLLLIHGTGDDNVHFQNTVSFIDALIAENKPFQLLIYPNRLHGIYQGVNTSLHLFTSMTDFILQNL